MNRIVTRHLVVGAPVCWQPGARLLRSGSGERAGRRAYTAAGGEAGRAAAADRGMRCSRADHIWNTWWILLPASELRRAHRHDRAGAGCTDFGSGVLAAGLEQPDRDPILSRCLPTSQER
jgi:hypothetical protein